MIAREDIYHRQLSVLIRELKELTEMDPVIMTVMMVSTRIERELQRYIHKYILITTALYYHLTGAPYQSRATQRNNNIVSKACNDFY
jgi:hypothetical protein